MYEAYKTNPLTTQQAIEAVGLELVTELLSQNVDWTSRVIDDCYEVDEMATSIQLEDEDGTIVEVCYLIDWSQSRSDLDPGDYDYSNPIFYIN